MQARGAFEADILSGLNEPQREAVTTTGGHLLVLSGPGSGKTRTVTHRIAHLIHACGESPHRILAVTFTNKAAGEMRERVGRLLSETGARLSTMPVVSTFHSFCVRVLRRYAEELRVRGINRNFSIYDDDDSTKLIKALLDELGIDKTMLSPRSVVERISRAKNDGMFAADYAAQAGADETSRDTARVYLAYEARLLRQNALDFDDLLLRCVQLLRERAAVADRLSNHIRQIHVDEFQDTCALQLALVRILSAAHGNVCAVADEDQAIYRFRGAVVGHVLEFEKHFPGAKVIKLGQNYRSTTNIVAVADAVIRHNRGRLGKTLWTANPAGAPVRLYEASDNYDEADYVADRIDEHLRLSSDEHPSVAVLYRTNAQSRSLEEALRRRDIPHKIVGGLSFYARLEIKDMMSYLKLASNPEDRAAFERAVSSPARGLGQKSLDKLYQTADAGAGLWAAVAAEAEAAGARGAKAKAASSPSGLSRTAAERLAEFYSLVERARSLGAGGDVSRMVNLIIEESGYGEALRRAKTEEADSRLENLGELISAASEYDGREDALRAFIDHAALLSSSDEEGGERDAPVVLMTAHTAKGLEFPVVFVVGLEQKLFPHSRSLDDEEEYEEERRLFYVAMTRARRELTLTYALVRRTYDRRMPSEPSAFLREIPLELLVIDGDDGGY